MFLVVVAIGVASDLWTKVWAFRTFTFHKQDPLLGDWLTFQLAYNRGAVWGILQGRVDLLATFSVLAVLFMLYILYAEPKRTLYFQVVLGLIVSGALGNLYDRVVHDQVRDFIVVWLGDYRWPTFNIADACICVGVTLFLLREMIYGEPAEGKKKSAKAS